jgi:hypothetical protein
VGFHDGKFITSSMLTHGKYKIFLKYLTKFQALAHFDFANFIPPVVDKKFKLNGDSATPRGWNINSFQSGHESLI